MVYLILPVKELHSFETSVNIYQCTRRHFSEESNLLHHRCNKVGSFVNFFVLIRWTYGFELCHVCFKPWGLPGHKPVLFVYIALWMRRLSQPSE